LERSGEQVGFWFPHGTKDKDSQGKWAKVVMKRLEGFEEAYKTLPGEGSCGAVKVVEEYVRGFVEDKGSFES
jgi:hypothetical protein